MRVLIAPDRFAGALTSAEVAAAIASGWSRQAPDDMVDRAPMSAGGEGFVAAVHAAAGGRLLAVTVTGPLGRPVSGTVLVVEDTAYVESGQACGRHLTAGARAAAASTRGVGELLLAALHAGAGRVVVGVGTVGTADGGAGLLAALGADADRPLDGGGAALDGIGRVDVTAARDRLAGAALVLATDVENPLAGLFGTVRSHGREAGLAEVEMPFLDGVLDRFGTVLDRRAALAAGAGAGGGLGLALLALGATRRSGFGVVANAVGLPARAGAADVVVTGQGVLDGFRRLGVVPAGVAGVAAGLLRPCVALSQRVEVGSRELRALGIDAAYATVDLVGEQRALGEPRESLAELAARVARTWSR